MTDTTADAKPNGNADVKRHMHRRSTWCRLIYMLILAVAWTIAEVDFMALIVLQLLAKLFAGEPIEKLLSFGHNLAEYMAAIVRVQTFVTEDLAFPFTPWQSAQEQHST